MRCCVQREKVDEEIVALRAQITQASESMKFQKSELETHRKLLKDGFVSATASGNWKVPWPITA